MMSAMRLASTLAFIAACGFDAPRPGVDATGDDGMWSVSETLTVPASGSVVTSKLVTEAGVDYRLRASGTYFYKLQRQADAEYYFEPSPPVDVEVDVDVGLAVNDQIVDADRTPRWGPYNPKHIYEVPWMGDGRPIVAMLHDGPYLDNVGTLTLQILEHK